MLDDHFHRESGLETSGSCYRIEERTERGDIDIQKGTLVSSSTDILCIGYRLVDD